MRTFWEKKWVTVVALVLWLVCLVLAVAAATLVRYGRSDGWYELDTTSFADTASCRQYVSDGAWYVAENIRWLDDLRADYLGTYAGEAFSYVVENWGGYVTADTTTENSVPVGNTFTGRTYRGLEYTVQGYVNLPVEPYQGCFMEYWLFETLFPLRHAAIAVLAVASVMAALCFGAACWGLVVRTRRQGLGRFYTLPVDAMAAVVLVLLLATSSQVEGQISLLFGTFVGYSGNSSVYETVMSFVANGCDIGRWAFLFGVVVYYSLAQLAAKQLRDHLLVKRLSLFWLTVLGIAGHLALKGWQWYRREFLGVYYYFDMYIQKGVIAYDLVFVALLLILLSQERHIRKAAQEIIQGNLDYKLDTRRLNVTWQRLGDSLNRIGDGMNQAVENQMRSERMKTELITNVSHDLKTPLTSMINYVALLKKPDLDEATRTQYLDVVDRQSQKLKKLTEDVVEASKAASGVMQVKLEPLDAGEILEQAVGEHSQRLRQAGIEPVVTVPKKTVSLVADGTLLGRVLENLLTNIAKYAQPGTRAYFDLAQGEEGVVFTVKNVSSAPLNISADELMERFVRGDDSRHSEGSGLGLSIAQSLTKLMGGTLTLVLDGDLFKAEIFFPAEKSMPQPLSAALPEEK
jgi:signal transduction histidine kinase